MAKAKPQRWFKVVGSDLHIFDAPYEHAATSVSVVGRECFSYYRANFNLKALWG